MKKAHLPPVTSLLVSFSLAFGILVSDLSGYRFLTTAHARGSSCSGKKVATKHVSVDDGHVLGGIHFRTIRVDGHVIPHGVIAAGVHINDTTIVGANGVIVSDGSPTTNGVIVSDGSPCANGVIVSDGSPNVLGVIVSDGSPTTNGVIVSDGSPEPAGVIVSDGVAVKGVIVSDGVMAHGGTLTGDNITVTDGVVTGENLRLTGTTIRGGTVNINGSITSVQISPAG